MDKTGGINYEARIAVAQKRAAEYISTVISIFARGAKFYPSAGLSLYQIPERRLRAKVS